MKTKTHKYQYNHKFLHVYNLNFTCMHKISKNILRAKIATRKQMPQPAAPRTIITICMYAWVYVCVCIKCINERMHTKIDFSWKSCISGGSKCCLDEKYMQHVADQILPSMRFQAGQSQYRSNLSRNHLKDKCITEQYNVDNKSHCAECPHVLRPDINSVLMCCVLMCCAPI